MGGKESILTREEDRKAGRSVKKSTRRKNRHCVFFKIRNRTMPQSVPNLVKVGLTSRDRVLQWLRLKTEKNADDCVMHHLKRPFYVKTAFFKQFKLYLVSPPLYFLSHVLGIPYQIFDARAVKASSSIIS